MFELDQIVPWGRSYAEYVDMFNLSSGDLEGRILGCGDGPASFNAEAMKRGQQVVSCDPLYRFASDDIRRRIDATFDTILEQARRNRDSFVWQSIRDEEELGQLRMNAMERFLADYDQGCLEGRYVNAALPELPFADGEFDLAVCSHLLFLYSDHLSSEFHVDAVLELCRVARDVRIFPLLSLGCETSPHLQTVCDTLHSEGFVTDIVVVHYEFQRGANKMLRVFNGKP